MSVDNQFASEFGHVRDPTQNDIQNTLFPTLESELSTLGDQPIMMTTSTNPITTTTSPNDTNATNDSVSH